MDEVEWMDSKTGSENPTHLLDLVTGTKPFVEWQVHAKRFQDTFTAQMERPSTLFIRHMVCGTMQLR